MGARDADPGGVVSIRDAVQYAANLDMVSNSADARIASRIATHAVALTSEWTGNGIGLRCRQCGMTNTDRRDRAGGPCCRPGVRLKTAGTSLCWRSWQTSQLIASVGLAKDFPAYDSSCPDASNAVRMPALARWG